MYQDILVIDNFFDNFELIKNDLRNHEFYDVEYWKQHLDPGATYSWPGKRTKNLFESNPYFQAYILETFQRKFNDALKSEFPLTFALSALHLRKEDDEQKDWIHKDAGIGDFTMLVYLSETNYNSGTKFYDEDKNCTATVNFIQNRAVLFGKHTFHSAFGHHGKTYDDARLTLNCFLKKV